MWNVNFGRVNARKDLRRSLINMSYLMVSSAMQVAIHTGSDPGDTCLQWEGFSMNVAIHIDFNSKQRGVLHERDDSHGLSSGNRRL